MFHLPETNRPQIWNTLHYFCCRTATKLYTIHVTGGKTEVQCDKLATKLLRSFVGFRASNRGQDHILTALPDREKMRGGEQHGQGEATKKENKNTLATHSASAGLAAGRRTCTFLTRACCVHHPAIILLQKKKNCDLEVRQPTK
jgi:hypothetical protein